ncbi:hypothetical protein ACOME3_001858 [Neoechinorhynchus agilis]
MTKCPELLDTTHLQEDLIYHDHLTGEIRPVRDFFMRQCSMLEWALTGNENNPPDTCLWHSKRITERILRIRQELAQNKVMANEDLERESRVDFRGEECVRGQSTNKTIRKYIRRKKDDPVPDKWMKDLFKKPKIPRTTNRKPKTKKLKAKNVISF